jgi:transcriptional regulator with XRE-family HTH domain
MWAGYRLKMFIEFKSLHEGIRNAEVRHGIQKLLNCTKQTVSFYEENKSRPLFDSLEKLAMYFNIPMDYFSDNYVIDKEEVYERISKSKEGKGK